MKNISVKEARDRENHVHEKIRVSSLRYENNSQKSKHNVHILHRIVQLVHPMHFEKKLKNKNSKSNCICTMNRKGDFYREKEL